MPRPALVPLAWVVWVLIVAGSKVFFPVSGALSEALPPRGSRAAYMATYQYAFTLAQVVAPAVVALFAVRSWLPWAVVGVTALSAVAVQGALGRAVPASANRVVDEVGEPALR